jgi:outer membrane protein assembly factor BamB
MDGARPDLVRAAPRLRALKVVLSFLVVLLLISPSVIGLQPSRDVWPQFRGWDDRVGTSPSTIPATNESLWTILLPDQVQSSFAVVGTRALVGCDDGHLYCLDADTGDELWKFKTANVVQSSPLVSEGRVYFGSSDGKGYCLRLENGTEIWNVSCNQIVASPALWNDTVYFADQWGGVCAVDIITGEKLWEDTFPLDVWASPTVVDGRLYVGDIAGNFRCYDAVTGDEEWNRSWPGTEIYSTPCVLGGRVIIGNGIGLQLLCLDAATGEDVWTFDLDQEVYSSVAVSDGVIYVHGWPHLWAIPWDDPDGSGTITTDEALWSFETNDHQGGSSPAVSGDRIVVGSDDGYLYCIDKDTGTELWKVWHWGFVYASPALARDRVYVGWTGADVECIGAPSKPRLYTTLTPTQTEVEGGQSIDIDITVLDGTGQPGGDAFMGYSASDGTLSATFGTVVEGEFRISWSAPDVSSTTTVTITATGELAGFDVVPAEIVITVEPAAEAPAPEVPRISHPALMAGIIALIIVDILIAAVILRGRRRDREVPA